eukprot:m.172797 g.172797  ORF g.172797 m.172797 type:complete len:176 (+) comp15376_c0_seq12:49-576(+)
MRVFVCIILLQCCWAKPYPPPPPAPPACQGKFASFPFCDTTKSTEERVADLVSRIKDEDKPGLLTARNMTTLPYLGIPEYYWGTNCIQSVENGAHGESIRCLNGTCATHFPNPPNMISTFNRDIMKGIGRAMAIELRGFSCQKHEHLLIHLVLIYSLLQSWCSQGIRLLGACHQS